MSKVRGFTSLEIAFAATLFVLISAAVFGIVAVGQDMYISSGNKSKASTRAHGLTDRLIGELRHATIAGEDVDNDNDPADLDTEDRNGNGVIDDDWSLADGDSAQWISFNKILPGGRVSPGVRIRFDGRRVIREFGGKSTVLATDVRALTFSRTGQRVEIYVHIRSGVETTRTGRKGGGMHLTRSVFLRN